MSDPVVEIRNLTVSFHTRRGEVSVVDGLSLSIERGRVLGVVGESGCGKSVMSRCLLRIEAPGKIVSGNVTYFKGPRQALHLEGMDAAGTAIRRIRWKEIAMIFQEPMSSFGPQHTIGFQIGEAMRLHGVGSSEDAVVDALTAVGMLRPKEVAHQYPHQLSGGMRQRAMIAMALSCRPSVLVADEPTTALDVSTEAQVLELIRSKQTALSMSVLFISHNLGVIAHIAHDVAVMYLGQVVERSPVKTLFANPKHPYTRALLQSIPRVDRDYSGPLVMLSGSPPGQFAPPSGCRFHPRCPERIPGVCDRVVPVAEILADGTEVRCHLWRKRDDGAAESSHRA
jgi:oligopeptide/dipeptide ABC transporter ATP-binding protein